MEDVFLTVLRMSGTAALVIAVVLLARFALRKAPKVFSYALWAVVLFRLLCPFTIESAFSLLPSAQVVSVAGRGEIPSQVIRVQTGITTVDQQVNDFFVQHPYQGNPALPENGTASLEPAAAPALEQPCDTWDWRTVPAVIWLAGTALLLAYSLISLLRLRRKLVGSVPLTGEKNVRLADHIPSPFVLGLFAPKIYLPSGLPESERDYILLHERTHIRRFDHVTRALAWLALAVHWFNPLVWLAFHLAGKDMEMSCDEAVLRKMGRDVRADYSTSLLRLSVGGKLPAGPLAFGGGDPQSRIKNVLSYKKPALWVVVIALIGVLCAGVALATDQSSPLIDPGSVVSVTAFDASSYTTTAQNTGVYAIADLRKDMLTPANSQVLSQEDGMELVRLINSHRKTVYGHGELTLNGREHHLKRIDCAGGDFYLVDYWYWNGFSFNPFHAGEDDYTTLVTYFDAEGNPGTTWQMEYNFDQAYCDLRNNILWSNQAGGVVDSIAADLTFSLEQGEDGGPFVRIDGAVDGIAVERTLWFTPAWFEQYGEESSYPLGKLWFELPLCDNEVVCGLDACWTDESRSAVKVTATPRAMISSYSMAGNLTFTVDLSKAGGTLLELDGYVPKLSPNAPELVPTEAEAVRVGRIAGTLLMAAESYYKSDPPLASVEPFVPTVPGVSYSLNELGDGVYINGLDCGGALWSPRTIDFDVRLGLPEDGALGFLSVVGPRFLGGCFANAQGNAFVVYYPEESGPLLVVCYDDFVDSIYDPSSIMFAVDLASGEVEHREISGYKGQAPEISDAEMADAARTLAQLIQGAAGSWETLSNPPAEEGPLPFGQPMRLWFGSGAGAWRTIMVLHADGSFEGRYNDSDMGSFGEGYPMGTDYFCTFHGKFGDIKQAGAASWSMTLEELVLDTGHPVGEEWIAERTRYISSTPYGLDGEDGQTLEPGAQFVFYTPEASGRRGGELHGMENESSGLFEFWTWWPERYAISEDGGGTLGCYALRNVETGYGFFDLQSWGIALEQLAAIDSGADFR